MRNYQKLRAFILADEIVLLTYAITKNFPKEEIYGLTSQMRRAAISIPSNIVEGCSRKSEQEFIRFLEIAYGSLNELKYQLSISFRLQYIATSDFELNMLKYTEALKVLGSLILKIRKG